MTQTMNAFNNYGRPSTQINFRRIDTAKMLKDTQSEVKILSNKLNRVLLTEETMHKQLYEGLSDEFEIYENETMNFKLRIRDRPPPLIISIKYLDNHKRDLSVYLSQDIREPSS